MAGSGEGAEGTAREPYPPISAKRRRAALAGALAPNPQAMVKLIGAGGAKNVRGLRAQMSYLGRNGDVPLRASESGFGVELGPGDVEGLAAAWGLPETDRGGSNRTSHFVVSFPRDTDPEAAERAERARAAELFDSGAHGERWEYYTAFYTDTAYLRGGEPARARRGDLAQDLVAQCHHLRSVARGPGPG